MDLKTTYLGLTLTNPLVCGASPLSADLDMVLRLEDAGAAAIVMHSLFEEQILKDAMRRPHLGRESPTRSAVVKESVSIPVAVKLSPFYSSVPNLAARLERIGADGLVLFNRPESAALQVLLWVHRASGQRRHY